MKSRSHPEREFKVDYNYGRRGNPSFTMKNIKEKVKEKKWILKSATTDKMQSAAQKISSKLKINEIIAKLLYSRGYETVDAAKKFIYMEREMLCNPFEMKDMQLGIDRIHSAIQNNEKITIYGDYDVDGVTAVCTLYLYLKSKGADVSYYIPNRASEGYGVSTVAIDMIAKNGTTLVITVETGTTATEEIEYANGLGIDFVITDHHECKTTLPEAVAVINPHRPDCKYPFKELAGVGVVFKCILAYEEFYESVSRSEASRRLFERYADLVAIGTIADVMPIKDENRLIVGYGLKMLEETERPGLLALIRASLTKLDSPKTDKRRKHAKITSGFIGYTLAPRINAAGRIRTAELAVELFLSKSLEEAEKIAEALCEANKERQREENKIMEEAYEKIDAIDIDKYPVLVLDADDWHHGVIGIVASRITDKYSRPSILVSFKQTEIESTPGVEIGKGSGRSIKGLNLVDALLYCSDSLVKFGGHELAAGLSVERQNLKLFRDKINEYARENLKSEDMIPTAEADLEIKFSDISLSFAEELGILEPYGVGNPQPVFVMKNIRVSEINPVSEGKHTRLVLTDGNSYVSAMFFSNSPSSLGIYPGDSVDVMFNVDINEWLGRRSVQLIVKDIKTSASSFQYFSALNKRYEEIHNGDFFTDEEDIYPTREDFAKLFRFLTASGRQGINEFSHRELNAELAKIRDGRNINYIKLKIMIKVFAELNIIGLEEIDEEYYTFKISYSTTKTDLEKSNILRKLRQQRRKN